MIVILKYSSQDTREFNKILEKLNLEYIFSLNESVVTNASHIILPDTFNVNKAIRKMQLMNLFSMLRMIKKPILGINNGFSLMCNNLIDVEKLGLGLFPINSKTCSINEDVQLSKTNYAEIEKKERRNKIGKINILRETKLLDQLITKTVNCNLERSVDVNEFTTSTVSDNKKEFSLTCENENYYSIQMEISENEKLFEKLIGNFVSL